MNYNAISIQISELRNMYRIFLYKTGLRWNPGMQLRFMTLFHTRKRLLSNDHIQMQLFILGNY
jgi:hypothetical protein